MSALWWIVLLGVLIACPILAGIYLRKARETGEAEKLREAIADLEREIGAAFLPILQRVAKLLAKWTNRAPP